ncbi:MAG: YkgJ family cysteine cluster protein [Coriobacteriales bacterium]|jgi:Fe-S-cluster containining protein|nr:YkgJ family cysteine cluster protein [Coriobacteriales bacterium]
MTNYYPECQCCGECCRLSVLCASTGEVERILRYLEANRLVVNDRGPDRCPFLDDDNRCQVYPVRTQTCRLYNCQKPRKQLLRENPDIIIDDKPLVDLRQTFVTEHP